MHKRYRRTGSVVTINTEIIQRIIIIPKFPFFIHGNDSESTCKMIKFILITLYLAITTNGATIEPDLQKALDRRSSEPLNIIVSMGTGNEGVLNKISQQAFPSSDAKRNAIADGLEALANKTQGPIIQYIQKTNENATVKSLWITNQISVRGVKPSLVNTLLLTFGSQIGTVGLEKYAVLTPIAADSSVATARQASNSSNTWGIDRIQAPSSWAVTGSSNGQGVVVGHIDSGVLGTHEALKGNFRGQYGWYDPANKSPQPNDNNGHGTHTMGTIAGANGIGVAPGATWMSCKGCQSSSCAQADLLACGQWILCPTLTDGVSGRNCSMAPRFCSNSWGSSLGGDSTYQSMVNAWVEAGIIPIFAAGNDGYYGCYSARSPGDYANVVSVGATTIDSELATFSSKGPVRYGFLGFFTRIKPEVSGPGQAVYSAWNTNDTSYNTISGTSMATPHAAGVVALILAAKPNATMEQVKQYLYNGVTTKGLVRPFPFCEFPYGFPNNEYGKGLINALRSVQSALNLTLTN